jgi:hypothetical protein
VKYYALITKIILIALCVFSFAGLVQADEGAGTTAEDIRKVCVYTDNNAQCTACAQSEGIWTAIGCIPLTPQGLFTKVFSLGIGIAGGIAFLLILFGGFQILVSAGNPEQLNEGRELISSAVAGLLLIIFSVFLLRLIGYDILRIPGFST